jgi:hypothetical protein
MTPDHSDRVAEVLDRLASAIEGNTQEMKALRDAIDDLRIEYEHAVRNGNCPYLAEAESLCRYAQEMELTEAQVRQAEEDGVKTLLGLRRTEKNTRADQVPETIACAHCDVDSPDGLAAALQEGWTRLERDDGASWNYLGVCPDCQQRELQEERVVQTGEAEGNQQQRGLF